MLYVVYALEILYKHTEPVIRHEEAIGDDPINIISD